MQHEPPNESLGSLPASATRDASSVSRVHNAPDVATSAAQLSAQSRALAHRRDLSRRARPRLVSPIRPSSPTHQPTPAANIVRSRDIDGQNDARSPGIPTLSSRSYHLSRNELPRDSSPAIENLYKQRQSKYFETGRVFQVMQFEPLSLAWESDPDDPPLMSRFGMPVHQKLRIVVAFKNERDSCIAVPVYTHGRHGFAALQIDLTNHGVIYTGNTEPRLSSAEIRRVSTAEAGKSTVIKAAIRVNADNYRDNLDRMSRVDYGKLLTINHHSPVRNIGKVHDQYLQQFIRNGLEVFTRVPSRSAQVRSAWRDALDAIRRESYTSTQSEPSRPVSDSKVAPDPKHTKSVATPGASAPQPYSEPATVLPSHPTDVQHETVQNQASADAMVHASSLLEDRVSEAPTLREGDLRQQDDRPMGRSSPASNDEDVIHASFESADRDGQPPVFRQPPRSLHPAVAELARQLLVERPQATTERAVNQAQESPSSARQSGFRF